MSSSKSRNMTDKRANVIQSDFKVRDSRTDIAVSIPEVLIRDSRVEINAINIGFAGHTSELIRAARALLRWEQRDLAHASGVSLPTIERLDLPGPLGGPQFNCAALRRALEDSRNTIHRRYGGGPACDVKRRERVVNGITDVLLDPNCRAAETAVLSDPAVSAFVATSLAFLPVDVDLRGPRQGAQN